MWTKIELQGEPLLLATIRDITEQRRMEEALRAGERRLRLFAENASDVIWTMDLSGHFTYMSPARERLMGYKWEEGMRLMADADMTPASRAATREMLAKIREMAKAGQRIPGKTIEVELVRRDGSTVWTEVTFSGMYDESDKLVGIQGITHDISERKQAETRQVRSLRRVEGVNRLQEELLVPGSIEKKFKQVTDAAVELLDLDFCRIWMVKPADLCNNGCIHAATVEGPNACRRRDQCLHLMASSDSYTYVDGNHCRVPFGAYKIGGIASGEDNKFLTNSVTTDPQVDDHQWAKSLGLVSFAGYKLHDANGDPLGVLAMFAKHPVSEEDDAFMSNLAETTSRVILRHQVAEELEKTRAQAVEANRAKSRFLASMSHEIRTPMTSILGYADLLTDSSLSPSSRNNYLAVIRRSGENLLTLINDILDLSKIEAGKLSLDVRRCDVVSLVADVASVVRPAPRDAAFPCRSSTRARCRRRFSPTAPACGRPSSIWRAMPSSSPSGGACGSRPPSCPAGAKASRRCGSR